MDGTARSADGRAVGEDRASAAAGDENGWTEREAAPSVRRGDGLGAADWGSMAGSSAAVWLVEVGVHEVVAVVREGGARTTV